MKHTRGTYDTYVLKQQRAGKVSPVSPQPVGQGPGVPPAEHPWGAT